MLALEATAPTRGKLRGQSLQTRTKGMSESPAREEGCILHGTCKAWKLEKGYGFATLDDGGSDLMMHQSIIEVEASAFRAIAAGEPATLRTLLTRAAH